MSPSCEYMDLRPFVLSISILRHINLNITDTLTHALMSRRGEVEFNQQKSSDPFRYGAKKKKKIEKEEDAGIHDVLTDVYSCRTKKKDKRGEQGNKDPSFQTPLSYDLIFFIYTLYRAGLLELPIYVLVYWLSCFPQLTRLGGKHLI